MNNTKKSPAPVRTSTTTWIVVSALGVLAIAGTVGVGILQNMVWFN